MRPGDDPDAYKDRALSRTTNSARANEIIARASLLGANLHEFP